jgi:hypothetical protein
MQGGGDSCDAGVTFASHPVSVTDPTIRALTISIPIEARDT